MRTRRRVAAAVAVATATALAPARAAAHRTDDFLQAARVGLEPDRVVITLDLTPGTEEAEPLLAALDRDHDGSFSKHEQRRFASEVMSALELAIDERVLEPRLASSSFPDPQAVRRGEGWIRLRIEVVLAGLSPGAHRLRFHNRFRADHSAYLANALTSRTARLTVTAQERASDQSEIVIAFTLRGD